MWHSAPIYRGLFCANITNYNLSTIHLKAQLCQIRWQLKQIFPHSQLSIWKTISCRLIGAIRAFTQAGTLPRQIWTIPMTSHCRRTTMNFTVYYTKTGKVACQRCVMSIRVIPLTYIQYQGINWCRLRTYEMN